MIGHEAAPEADRAPVVLLHEGLGSARSWRGLPAAIAETAGRRVIAYSRHGHGRSAPLRGPRGPDYMHHEALEVLPALLDSLGHDRAVLVGHSDGASIALIHAATERGRREVSGLVLLAPHVIVEQRSIDGIAAARQRYLSTDLPQRMARHHDDADALFWAWNDIWLDPGFRDWDLTPLLPEVVAPILGVQGEDDEYGTLHQLDLVERGAAGRVERLHLPDCGHSPHLEHPEPVVEAITDFLAHVD